MRKRKLRTREIAGTRRQEGVTALPLQKERLKKVKTGPEESHPEYSGPGKKKEKGNGKKLLWLTTPAPPKKMSTQRGTASRRKARDAFVKELPREVGREREKQT